MNDNINTTIKKDAAAAKNIVIASAEKMDINVDKNSTINPTINNSVATVKKNDINVDKNSTVNPTINNSMATVKKNAEADGVDLIKGIAAAQKNDKDEDLNKEAVIGQDVKTEIEISIIIVNYNTGELLYNCLESIKDSLTVSYEVITVDNASGDGSFERCRDAFGSDDRFFFCQTGENLGFAKANNIGAKLARGRVLHFLNPDTEVCESLNADYDAVLADPGAVYVNPLINRDGSLENDKMPIPCLKDLILWTVRSPKARFWYKGASVIISFEDFRKIGEWSEDYFLYSEDLDLFYKVWMAGVPIKSLESRIFHLGQGSSSRRWTSIEREVVVQRSMRIFFRKYFSTAQYLAVKIWYLFHNLVKHPSTVPFYLKAWRLSGR